MDTASSQRIEHAELGWKSFNWKIISIKNFSPQANKFWQKIFIATQFFLF